MDSQLLTNIGYGSLVFAVSVFVLALVVLLARNFLVKSGQVSIEINDGKKFSSDLGLKLTSALSQQGIYLSMACGGRGSCGQCCLVVKEGGGDPLPCETPHFTKAKLSQGYRLGCQVSVKKDMKIEVDPSIMEVKKWECEVVSNPNVATFIKELTLKIPEGESVPFRAGGYVELKIPAYHTHFKDFEIEEEYREDWNRFKIWDHESKVNESTTRAYSMACYPAEEGFLKFNIRIATPPPGSSLPPGKMSSYVFGLKPKDKIEVSGPFGEFFVRDTKKEKIFIGGGAGMAPFRSQLFDLLKTKGSQQKLSYWYGARSLRELFYDDEFKALAKENSNFSWHVAMSAPQPEDNWKGHVGFIHQVLYDNYLKTHEAPEECEYYLCGPPMMIGAVLKMLDVLGVERENILFDDFGG